MDVEKQGEGGGELTVGVGVVVGGMVNLWLSATSSNRAGISCQDSRQLEPALCKQMAYILQSYTHRQKCLFFSAEAEQNFDRCKKIFVTF